MKILDQYGRPIDRAVINEPQTARVASLANTYLTSQLDGLTPARLASILRAADNGDLVSQHRLFADMEERDPHLLCEIGKRKNALLGLDWEIVPPRDASAAEKQLAEWVKEVLTDAADPFEDLLLALMDGVGHGFAATELEWRREGKELLPEFHPRPQEWFRLSPDRRELRLLDGSAEGAPLAPFGWVLHTHGKAKTGYQGRMGLHRALVWPFLYKAYSVGDLAEFLETYGLPIITGKYFAGASDDEKASLFRAVTALGHDARAIMPAGMEIEIAKITSSGDGTPHLAMTDWADRAQSKCILGQVLSAEAKATGLGSGLANVHNEVRRDILKADARQVAGTVTLDLIYPLIALNRGGLDSLRRCPRLVFDTGEAEDVAAYAEALPKLVGVGFKIPRPWAQEKLRIPEPEADEDVLATAPAAPASVEGGDGGKPTAGVGDATQKYDAALINAYSMGIDRLARLGVDIPQSHIRQVFQLPAPKAGEPVLTPPANEPPSAALAALTAGIPGDDPAPDQTALDVALDAIPAETLAAMGEQLLRPVLAVLDQAGGFEEALTALAARFPEMDTGRLEELLGRAMFAAELWGYHHGRP